MFNAWMTALLCIILFIELSAPCTSVNPAINNDYLYDRSHIPYPAGDSVCTDFSGDFDGTVAYFPEDRRLDSPGNRNGYDTVTATLTCSDALKVPGVSSLRCKNDGTGTISWDGPAPRCLRVCDDYSMAFDGTVDYNFNDRRLGSIATFTCADPAKVPTASSSSCAYFGGGVSWSGLVPECLPACDDYSMAFDGTVDYNFDDRRLGSIATFTCADPAKVLTASSLGCGYFGGGVSWSGPVPDCLPACDDYSMAFDGTVNYNFNDRRLGSIATFTCADPAKVLTASSLSCGYFGGGVSWSGLVPECLPVCDDYSMAFEGTVDYNFNDRRLGSIATFTCDHPAKFPTASSLSCGYFGGEVSWSGPVPDCLPACDDISMDFDGTIAYSFNDRRLGATATFTCSDAMKVPEVSTLSCVPSGAMSAWTGPAPDCLPALCYGKCGGSSGQGCWCDGSCTAFGDCCFDYNVSCSGDNPVAKGTSGQRRPR